MKPGRNQIIAAAAMGLPFIVATFALFLGNASFIEWAAYMQVHLPICLGITLGGSAVSKIAKAKNGG